MFNKVEGVLMQLNDAEMIGLERILDTAENHLDEVPRSYSFETIVMIDGLREVFGIKTYDEQPEARLIAVARRSFRLDPIECTSADCETAITSVRGFKAWMIARSTGWALAHPDKKDALALLCPACSDQRRLTR